MDPAAKKPMTPAAANRKWLARLRPTAVGRLAKFFLDRMRLVRILRSLHHLQGPRRPELARDEMIVLCLVRNGELHLRSFVEHHLRQGARWVILVDNGSTDRTVAMARDYSQVVVWRSLLPFRPYEWLMRRHLVERFARNRWSLSVDVDERFDYPFSDRLPLASLLGYLDHYRYTAVVAYMLDRFASGPVGSQKSTPDDDPAELFRLYDLSNVSRYPYHQFSPPEWGNELSDPNVAWYRNGIRESVFGADVSLTKQPLVFFGRGTLPRPANHVRRAHIADFTAVLHHYKFLCDFRPYVEMVVRENIFPPDSIQYRRILQKLRENPELTLESTTAREFRSLDELVAAGFLTVSPALRKWTELHSHAR